MQLSIIEYLYSKSGRSISARMNESHLRSNGYSELVDQMLIATSEYSELSFTERLRMFIFDKIHPNHCKTCGVVLREWAGRDWKKFCCMKCVQNDPDNKAAMLAGQSSVDWKETIAKRESTMQERYGISAISQSSEMKSRFVDRTKEAWSDPDRKSKRIKTRTRTNIEKYGVEHTSQRSEQRIASGQAISRTRQSKTVEVLQHGFD